MASRDNLQFADEQSNLHQQAPSRGWKILLVDDEPAVHDVTLLALHDFEYDNQSLTFLHAYSAQQARELFAQHDDIAVALIDVVMETDDAGLQLVNWIRKDLDNTCVRLILRTGQPGQAPEKQVVVELDINDYREKAELTFNKLYTLMVTSIRSYLSLYALEKSRRGLVRIIESSRGLATHGSIEKFVEGVLLQLQAVFGVDETAFYCDSIGAAGEHSELQQDFLVASGIGEFSGTQKLRFRDIEGSALHHGISQALAARTTQILDDSCYLYFIGEHNNPCVIFINRLNNPLDDSEKGLLEVFSSNISHAFDNLALQLPIGNRSQHS